MLKWVSGLFIVALWSVSVQAAEVMYVTDKLYLGLYSEKGDKGEKVKTLVSGSKLFIDLIEGGYAQVETDQGLNGWVKKRFLVEKPPAIVQLKLLQTEQDSGIKSVVEKQALQTENKALTEKNVLLEKKERASQKKITELQRELEQLKKQSVPSPVMSAKTLNVNEADCPKKSQMSDSESEKELLELKQRLHKVAQILNISTSSQIEESEITLFDTLKNNPMILFGGLLLIILLSFLVGAKWVSWRIRSKLGGDLVW